MGRPQQPEIARSGRTDVDPDWVGTELEGRKGTPSKGPTGPIPAENEPGHHPPEESDKPDPDAFVARMRGEDRTDNETPPDEGSTPSVEAEAASVEADANPTEGRSTPTEGRSTPAAAQTEAAGGQALPAGTERSPVQYLATGASVAAGVARSGVRLSGKLLGRLQGMVSERLARRT